MIIYIFSVRGILQRETPLDRRCLFVFKLRILPIFKFLYYYIHETAYFFNVIIFLISLLLIIN